MEMQGARGREARPGGVSSVVSALSVRKPEVQIPRLAPLARDDGARTLHRCQAPVPGTESPNRSPRLAPLARDDGGVQIPRLAALAQEDTGLAPLTRQGQTPPGAPNPTLDQSRKID